MVLAIFNCIHVPLMVSFDDPALKASIFIVISSMIDVVFLFDMFVAFRTAYIDDVGNEVTNGKQMATNYLKTSFIIDCLATIPFDTILSASDSYLAYKAEAKKTNSVPWVDLLGILKLGRLLRLSNIIHVLKASGDVKSSLKLMKLCLFLVVYWHCFACNWWFMVKTDRLWIPVIDQPSGKYFNIYDASFVT